MQHATCASLHTLSSTPILTRGLPMQTTTGEAILSVLLTESLEDQLSLQRALSIAASGTPATPRSTVRTFLAHSCSTAWRTVRTVSSEPPGWSSALTPSIFHERLAVFLRSSSARGIWGVAPGDSVRSPELESVSFDRCYCPSSTFAFLPPSMCSTELRDDDEKKDKMTKEDKPVKTLLIYVCRHGQTD